MCGICGIFISNDLNTTLDSSEAIQTMTRLMARRGPDDEGFWFDPAGQLQLGFRRLAILDLSSAGHQPMVSANERSVLVFNGEIYNYLELRHELEQKGVSFRSRADSEVLLEALNLWGVAALERLNGMFAFGWYDRGAKTLLLARDHAGIKPLYYFQHPQSKGVAFASQYDALFHNPWGKPGPPRLDVLHLYLRLHHIPPPYTLFENTYQLEPGHYVLVRADGSIEKRDWWRLPRNPKPDLAGVAADEALSAALDNAIRRQRIADVPLGVFLSGGVDSPLVTAVARHQTGSDLKAYTIGNPGWWQDESEAASAYARHLDVDFHLHAISGEEALNSVPDVITSQYEPFGDFSIIPTLMVSRFARTGLTVALSGDGGDELFFGYERPLSLLKNGADFRWPWLVRLALYGAGKYGLGPRRSGAVVFRTPGDYYFNVNSRMSPTELHQLIPELPGLPADFTLYQIDRYKSQRDLANYSRWVEFYGQMQRGLKKVDMASMHHSLEVRVPLLDREVIEVALRIDPFSCMKNGTRKAVLRSSLERFVPVSMIPTPKRGFAVPLDEWLRGPLRPMVEATLFDQTSGLLSIFDSKGIRNYWQNFLARKANKWGLWTLITLHWWLQKNSL